MISSTSRERFLEDGYLVIPSLVPEADLAPARAAIDAWLDIDPSDAQTWYRNAADGHGIVPVHHDPSFWALRQNPDIYRVFSALYDTGALWVSMDRASFNPPADGWARDVRVDPIHWDGDPCSEGSLSIQGVVYLTDTAEAQGPFCCVPDAYRHLTAFLTTQSEEALDRMRPDIRDHEVVPVPAPAGSLIVWHNRMPHSSTANRTDRPRYTLYVAMEPALDEEERLERIRLFEQKRPPAWAEDQKIANQQIPETGPDVSLSPLGRRLAGLDPW